MDTKQVIGKIRKDVEGVRGDGQVDIKVDDLLEYLTNLESDAGSSLEYAKLAQQAQLAHNDQLHRSAIEISKWTLDAGKDALQALILLSGGGVVALLTFLGALVPKGIQPQLGAGVAMALSYFGAGVLCGSICFALRYLSQMSFHEEWNKTGTIFTALSITVGITGYVSCCLAVYTAASSFLRYFKVLQAAV